LSIHFYDLVRVLAPDVDWRVVAASMSRSYGEADVEDFSATLVEGAAAGRPSKPYFYPGPGGEVGLSVNVGGDCYRWSGAQRQIFLTRADGSRETFETESDQVASYALFVEDTLRRIQGGEAPLAGLAEMAQAARMAEAAYRLAGYDDFMI
jgi:predicted dehydrogenase